MSNARSRRDRRRPRTRSNSPHIYNNKRDLRNDLRNNLRHRSRTRSPRMIEGDRNKRPRAQYSPTDNFRGNRLNIADEERFYLEQQHREELFFLPEQKGQASPEIEIMQHSRRNFRSTSRDRREFYVDAPGQRGLNFEPSNSHSRNTRFSPPDPHMNIRQFVDPQQSSTATIVYQSEVVEAAPVLYKSNNVNPFATTLVVDAAKMSSANVTWQPPPEEVIIIADPDVEPELEMDHATQKRDLTVPTFDPDNEAFNSRQFIERLDELGKIHKWNEEELKYNFVTHIGEAAKSFQINSNRMMNPWNNVKRTFINTFPPQMDYYKKLKEMLNRQMTPNESIKTYIMHKTMLMNQAEVFGRRAVSCIIAGLQQHSEDVRETANKRNFGTPEELLVYITEVDAVAKAAKKHEAVQQQIPPLMSEASIIQAQQLAKQRLQLNASICYTCMREGHTSKECDALQPAKRQIIPKHCIEVSVNGITFPGYNDLSSSCVTIRESEAKKANIPFQRHITCIRGFGNASVTALGGARVIIRVDKVMLSFEVSIVPNAAQDVAVVIGRNFREHPAVRYVEAEMGISFTQIQMQNSSFSANERLMASFNSTGEDAQSQSGSRNSTSSRQMDKQRRRY